MWAFSIYKYVACYAGFGEASPEAKAANNLHNFFTYIAVKIVTAQLQVHTSSSYHAYEDNS